MAGGGTGRPVVLRCTTCKRDHWGKRDGRKLVATGRTKPLSCSQAGCGGSRVLQYQVEYRCLECGHIGWTRHSDAARLQAAVTAAASPAT